MESAVITGQQRHCIVCDTDFIFDRENSSRTDGNYTKVFAASASYTGFLPIIRPCCPNCKNSNMSVKV